MDRPRRNSRYPRDFKLRVVEAYLRGEGDRRALALEHGVRNGAQTRDRAKRRRGGGDDAPVVHPPGRRRKEPAGEEALDRRCARLEMEAGTLRRTAASAAALSSAGGSTRRRSRRGGNIRSPRSRSPSGCRAPPIAATRRAPLGQAGGRAAGHSGDMREIPVQIRIPTRCRHVAQSGRHSHRRQDGAQGRARGGAAVPGPQAQEAPLLHGPGRQHRMCPPIGSRSSGRGSPGPCPAKETASTTRRPGTSSRRPRPSFATIGRDGPDVFEGDPEKHIDRYSNVRIKRRLDGSGPVECRLSRAA